MSRVYKHKKWGWQIHYIVYLPDGTSAKRYKARQVKAQADELRRRAEDLEKGSRAGNLSPREVAEYTHLGLLSEKEARMLAGGKAVVPYDLERVLARYETTSSVKNTSSGHATNQRRAAALTDWLQVHPIPSLTSADVRAWVRGRIRGDIVVTHRLRRHQTVGVSPKTARCDLTVLQAILDEAVDLGMVEKNVAREVAVPVRTRQVRRAMTVDEVNALLAATDQRPDLCRGYAREAMRVALYTGLRRAELRALRWADINLGARKVYIQAHDLPDGEKFTPKAGDLGVIDLPEALVPVLEGMERRGPFVFGGDRPLHANLFYRAFKKLAKQAGLDASLTLHHTRHTFGSHLLAATGDLALVQGAMRHLDMATTKEYVHTVRGLQGPVRRFDYGGPAVDS